MKNIYIKGTSVTVLTRLLLPEAEEDEEEEELVDA